MTPETREHVKRHTGGEMDGEPGMGVLTTSRAQSEQRLRQQSRRML